MVVGATRRPTVTEYRHNPIIRTTPSHATVPATAITIIAYTLDCHNHSYSTHPFYVSHTKRTYVQPYVTSLGVSIIWLTMNNVTQQTARIQHNQITVFFNTLLAPAVVELLVAHENWISSRLLTKFCSYFTAL